MIELGGQQTPAPAAGDMIKDVTEATFMQDVVDASQTAPVIVDFWATWCKPCVAELPYFEELNNKHDNIQVILVSLDFEQNIEKQVIPFLEKRKIQSQVDILLDQKANVWIDKVDPSWSGAIPATLIIKGSDKKFYEQSFHSLQELESIVL